MCKSSYGDSRSRDEVPFGLETNHKYKKKGLFIGKLFILLLVPLEERLLVIELFPYRKFWGKAMGVLLGRMAQTSSIVLRFLVTYVSSTGLNLIPNICSNRSVASTSCSPMGMAPP